MIHEPLTPPAEAASSWEVPAPVLMNTWKHHAGALRQRIRAAVANGPAGLDELAGQMVVIGSELMDLYTGLLTPAEIAARVLALLEAEGRLPVEAYRVWIESNRGYRVLTFVEDGSRWCLRVGDESDRYVHVHPGRWAPQTRRVRANVLKTAVLALAHAGLHGGDPRDRELVNHVRRQYLGLAPVGKELVGDQGLGAMIDVLLALPEN
jgi:hypothetical protein